MIKSNQFQFRFNYSGDGDVNDYVTPYYVDDFEMDPNFICQYEKNTDATTFIYLPLNENYKKANLRECPINAFFLLFSRNIQQIVIENHLENEIINIKHEKVFIKSIESEHFKEFQLHECTLIEDHIIDNERFTVKTKFYLYECKIEISNDLTKEVSLKETNEIKLSIAFPFINNLDKKFPVYSLVPIFDLGFKFILNTYWNLNTSREGVTPLSNYNLFLRDKFSEIFCLIAKTDSYIRHNLKAYILLSNQKRNEGFWTLFIKDIQTRLKTILEDDLFHQESQNDQQKIQINRVYDDKLKDLVNDEILCLGGIKLINDVDYLKLGFEKLTLKDILSCFKPEINGDKMKKTNIVNDEWWEEFFRLIKNDYKNKLISLSDLENCEIFLIKNNSSCVKRSSIKINSLNSYFINLDNRFDYWWNESIKLVNYESIKEWMFLNELLNSRICEQSQIIDFIILSQEDKNIELNARFLKENYLNKSQLYLFKLPTVGFHCLHVKECTVRSLFGIDLQDACYNNNQKFIDYTALNISHNIKERLEWENFFIDLDCALPEIDPTKWNKLTESIQNSENILNNFKLLDENDAKLAIRILDNLCQKHTQISKLFKDFPIRALCKAELEYIPIKSVFIKRTFKEFLPCIDLPSHTEDFYSKLGVISRLDFDSCVKILKILANKETIDGALYYEWFNKLREFPNQKVVIDSPIVYLRNLTDGIFNFYSGNQVYCINENDCIFKICKYTHKTIVNSKFNKDFNHLESVLLSLGAHASIEIDDILDALERIYNDKSLFNQIDNFEKLLRNDVYNDVRDLFLCLEEMLTHKLADLNYNKKHAMFNLMQRKNMINNAKIKSLLTKEQKKKLKLITQRHEMLNYFGNYDFELFCCHDILVDIHEKFIEDFKRTAEFFDQEIAFRCPLIVTLFEPTYLDSYLNIQFNTKPTFETCEILNKFARDNFNLRGIKILKIEYFKLFWTFKNESLRDLEIRDRIIKNIPYFIVGKNLIVITKDEVLKDSLRHFINVHKIAVNLNEKEQNLDKLTWEKINYEIKMDLNELILPNFYKVYARNKLVDNIDFSDEKITRKINEIEVRKNYNLGYLKNFNGTHLDDYDFSRRVGIKAEQILHLYLKKHYESYDPTKNWKSTARNIIDPSMEPGDDMLGYDFEINDEINHFSNNKHRCFLEVKGKYGKWEGSFYVTENELQKKEKINENKESYIVVVIDNVDDLEKTEIYAYNWSQKPTLFKLKKKLYEATLEKNF
jgi:hypothetical protein